jgi:16S rRNA (guanine527-N7)-methyltransferase
MGCQRTGTAAMPDLPLLRTAPATIGVSLSAEALAAFARYYALLAEHGARFNLTRVLDVEGVQVRHFAESLAVGAALEAARQFTGIERVMDVGSGAGFPGIPLRIAWPGVRLTLLEATGKKARFLQLVVDELGLAGVGVVNARAEEAGHDAALREAFDVVTARAVAPLPALAEVTLPFARIGGCAALVKGSRLPQELRDAAGAISRCGGGRADILPLAQFGEGPAPRLLMVPKTRRTPADLPRAPGVPASRPLR